MQSLKRKSKGLVILCIIVGVLSAHALITGYSENTSHMDAGITMDSTPQEYRDINGDGHITDCEKLYPELMEAMLEHDATDGKDE